MNCAESKDGAEFSMSLIVDEYISAYNSSISRKLGDNPVSKSGKHYSIVYLLDYVDAMSPDEFNIWSDSIEKRCLMADKYSGSTDNVNRLIEITSAQTVSNFYNFANDYAFSDAAGREKYVESINDQPLVVEDLYISVVHIMDEILVTTDGDPITVHFSSFEDCERTLIYEIACHLAQDAIDLYLEGEDPRVDINLACDTADEVLLAISRYRRCKSRVNV